MVRVPVWELLGRDGVGAPLGATVKYLPPQHRRLPADVDDRDSTATRSFRPARRRRRRTALYTVCINIDDENGNRPTAPPRSSSS